MKKWMLTIIMAISVASSAHAVQVVDSSGTKFVEVSLKDVNRIVCPVNVGNVIYSVEKHVQVKVEGRNVFVKFTPLQSVDSQGRPTLVYSKEPRDLYVECGGKFFSLILIPKDYPAQTVILKVPLENKKAAFKFEASNDYEKNILRLIRAAYLEMPPAGYDVKDINKQVRHNPFQKVKLYLRRTMTGVHFKVYEYVVEAKAPVRLDESQFLNVVYHPLAISIVNPVLPKGQSTRMFIVTGNKEANNEP